MIFSKKKMKLKNVIIPAILMIFLSCLISAYGTGEYRWGNVSATCILATGEPNNASITTIGECVVESFNMTGLNLGEIYNSTFIYVWRLGTMVDDYTTIDYCYSSSGCTAWINARTYNNTNTPVDFYTNGSSTWLRINAGNLNYTQLSWLRLRINYVKTGGADSQNDIDALGMSVVDKNLPLIQFISPTPANDSFINGSYILVNVTATDMNLANITIKFFNSSRNLIGSATTSISPNFENFSVMAYGSGIYYFNATAYDTLGNKNYTETRRVNVSVPTCTPNFVANYTPCNILDNSTKYYYDSNYCGNWTDIPADNGTIVYCDYCVQSWYCADFDTSCGSGVPELNCLNVSYQNASCCSATGLPTDCNYSSIGNYSDYNLYCGDIEVTFVVPTYPYVDFNVSYPMALLVTQNNITFNDTSFKINITEPSGNSSVFNWTWDSTDKKYELTLLFTEVGDYPFKVYAEYPYDNIPNIYGTFIVRVPFYVTFQGFETKNQATSPYINDFAYVFAEKTDKMYYDKVLESFITPILFNGMFNTSVFHAPYIDGEATIKLWDNNTNYAIRLVDGRMNFDSIYSVPNISDSYGTNIYIGKFYWNGSTDEIIKVYLSEREIHQYRWLFNWIFVIGLVLVLAISIFMFFVIPAYPQISIIFGLGFTAMLVLFRIFIFLWKSW